MALLTVLELGKRHITHTSTRAQGKHLGVVVVKYPVRTSLIQVGSLPVYLGEGEGASSKLR